MKRVEPRNYINEYQKLSGEKICPPVFAQICHKFCRLAGSPGVFEYKDLSNAGHCCPVKFR